jgi:hypothetical protein
MDEINQDIITIKSTIKTGNLFAFYETLASSLNHADNVIMNGLFYDGIGGATNIFSCINQFVEVLLDEDKPEVLLKCIERILEEKDNIPIAKVLLFTDKKNTEFLKNFLSEHLYHPTNDFPNIQSISQVASEAVRAKIINLFRDNATNQILLISDVDPEKQSLSKSFSC